MEWSPGGNIRLSAGTYTLEPTSKAEEVAVKMLKEGDLVINIVDATNLERNLYLTLELLERETPLIVCLNMWDDTKHRGGEIDVKKLEEILKVPIIPTCGLTGEGVKELVARLPQASSPRFRIRSPKERWQEIGKIIAQVQKLFHRHHTFLETLEDLSIKPLTGLPIALLVIFSAFWIIRFLGENLIGYIFEPLFERLWLPLMMEFSLFLGRGDSYIISSSAN